MRDDLFTVIHEQFMTETAELADVVLPATMFLEHDDIYRGGGHQHLMLGPRLIDPPEGPKPNLFVINELGKRLGVAWQRFPDGAADFLAKAPPPGTLGNVFADGAYKGGGRAQTSSEEAARRPEARPRARSGRRRIESRLST